MTKFYRQEWFTYGDRHYNTLCLLHNLGTMCFNAVLLKCIVLLKLRQTRKLTCHREMITQISTANYRLIKLDIIIFADENIRCRIRIWTRAGRRKKLRITLSNDNSESKQVTLDGDFAPGFVVDFNTNITHLEQVKTCMPYLNYACIPFKKPRERLNLYIVLSMLLC